MSKLSRLGGIAVLACLFPWVGFAQDNSFAMTIQNGAMWQANLSKQMINLGGTTSGGPRPFSAANCMPPADLQRGADGHVPPELQGDHRNPLCRRRERLLDNAPAGTLEILPEASERTL